MDLAADFLLEEIGAVLVSEPVGRRLHPPATTNRKRGGLFMGELPQKCDLKTFLIGALLQA
jgi:hypothetical protein